MTEFYKTYKKHYIKKFVSSMFQ